MEYTIEGDRIIVRIDRDEEILESLKNICSEQNIKSGQIMGIGATKRVTLRYLDQPLKTFNEHIVDEGCEIASFIGNISQFEDDVYLHCHIVLGRSDFSTLSGHCHEAVVGATFEGVIFKGTSDVSRVFSEEIGLNLYKF